MGIVLRSRQSICLWGAVAARSFAYGIIALLSGCSLSQGIHPSHERIYTVSKGDTLETIARRAGVPAEDIAIYNHIRNPKTLSVGRILKIPAEGPLSLDPVVQSVNSADGAKVVSISHVKRYVGALSFPVQGAQFTSPFGYRGGRFHEGADFAAPEGTPVYAAHDGKVVFASDSFGKYGKIVVIQGEGLMTVYGHNSHIWTSSGDVVRKGDHISDVGETGRASGPHLHFETRVMDREGRFAAVDPYLFFVRLGH
jgi:murein DD-endopeptidase MepM/ murein hydrolase activator NlpD